MSYDIYGNPLRRGHCEVHPHVHEEYPCSVCMAESRRQQEAQSPAQCNGNPAYCESAHYLGQAQEEIKSLNDEIQALRNVATALIEFQTDYEQSASQPMPGNDHWSERLIEIVDMAYEAMEQQP